MKVIGTILVLFGLGLIGFAIYLWGSDERFAIMSGIFAIPTFLTGIGFLNIKNS